MANAIFLRKGDQHTYPVPRVNITVHKVDAMKIENLNTVKVGRLFKQQQEDNKQ